MNVNGNHWITVLMHNAKKEFQVLDSLGPTGNSILEPSVLWYVFISYLHTFNLVGTCIIIANKNLYLQRAEIAKDITEANKYVETQFPDVTAWPVME